MTTQQLQTLESLLYNCKVSKKKKKKKDEISRKTVALASGDETESYNVHTNFMTYTEMKAYLFGLYENN